MFFVNNYENKVSRNDKEIILSKKRARNLKYYEKRYGQRKSHENNYSNYNNYNDDDRQQRKPQKSVELTPKSVNQEKYIVSLTDPEVDVVTVFGPAGTGKTYLAMLTAIKFLREGKFEKILLTRPAVAVDDEKHGFLPGDLNSKMEPWVKPLFDILREFYSMKELEYMLNEQIIEIVPLAFCRGRTFKHSFIIVDEAQNATPSQIKMLLTRIGENSKIAITGDIDQTDRNHSENGLLDLISRLNKCTTPRIAMCEFTPKDVKRHSLISTILNLYK